MSPIRTPFSSRTSNHELNEIPHKTDTEVSMTNNIFHAKKSNDFRIYVNVTLGLEGGNFRIEMGF